MELNRNFIILAAVAIAVIILMLRNKRTEPYQPTLLPFQTEGVVYPHEFDRFYQRELDFQDKVADFALGKSRKDSEIPKQSNVCSDTMKVATNNNRFKECCKKCIVSLKNQEANTKHYYKKYREYQDKNASLENQLNFAHDLVRSYQKRIGNYKRELTLSPITQKCHGQFKKVPNGITGLGVEKQFRQG